MYRRGFGSLLLAWAHPNVLPFPPSADLAFRAVVLLRRHLPPGSSGTDMLGFVVVVPRLSDIGLWRPLVIAKWCAGRDGAGPEPGHTVSPGTIVRPWSPNFAKGFAGFVREERNRRELHATQAFRVSAGGSPSRLQQGPWSWGGQTGRGRRRGWNIRPRRCERDGDARHEGPAPRR
jgi:hypothetical protein